MSPEKIKMVAAISGGVDSSAAAALYHDMGYEVVGATLNMRCPDPAFNAAQGCCGKEDRDQAAAAARLIGIEHHFIDLYPEFEHNILEYCWNEYSHGRTPNPCVFCNQIMKFGKLLEFADSIGAAGLITGHYAKIFRDNHTFRIRRGDDPAKDQTYFLYRLQQNQIARIQFPVGEMTKTQVRDYARKIGLENAEKKDSQDACFSVPGECFAETLRRLFHGSRQKGNFIYQGKVVGQHNGIHLYTIGQRKGLGVALGVPAYVSAINPDTGDVVLTTDNDNLLASGCFAHDISWQSGEPEELPLECMVQIRYRSRPVAAEISYHKPGILRVDFKQSQRAVTPGQAAVFFRDDILLGGGTINLLQ
jgi:tRNA-specific 2-thiouridylase